MGAPPAGREARGQRFRLTAGLRAALSRVPSGHGGAARDPARRPHGPEAIRALGQWIPPLEPAHCANSEPNSWGKDGDPGCWTHEETRLRARPQLRRRGQRTFHKPSAGRGACTGPTPSVPLQDSHSTLNTERAARRKFRKGSASTHPSSCVEA